MRDERFDICVLGGGPAGATAARLLTQWGHRVAIVTRQPSAQSLAESLPPSIVKVLERVRLRHAVDAAGFMRATGNTVWWGAGPSEGAEPRAEYFADGALGYQVPRAALDALLLREAHACTLHDGTVRRVVLPSDGGETRADGESGTVHVAGTLLAARWILDCTGRSGVVARREWRREVDGLRTLALVGTWERLGGWSLPDATHTLVESYANGWTWSVPLTPKRRQVTVMVDPALTQVGGRAELTRVYLAELSKAPRMRGLTRASAAQMLGAPFARDASAYSAHRVAAPGVLLVGDAASFVDPLSSFGIKKALVSAWLAAVVTHTCLTEPHMTAAALELYEARERAMYDALQRQRSALAREALDGSASEFWSARSVPDDGEPNDLLDIETLRSDPEILAAFEELKQRATITLRQEPALTRVSRPAVHDNRIVLAEQLCAPAFPLGVRHVRNIDLVALVDLVPSASQVPDLYDAYCRRAAPVPLGDFLGALSLLIAKRMLVFA